MRSARVAQGAEVRERNVAVARWGVEKVQTYLDNVVENIHLLIELGELQAMNPATAEAPLSYFLNYFDDIKEVSLLDVQGQERVRLAESRLVTPADLVSQAGSPKFQVARSGETYIGLQTTEFSEPILTVALPVRDLAADRVVGVLTVEVNLKRLWNQLLSFKVGERGYLYLVDGAGHLLAHPDFSLVLARKDLSGVGAVRRFLTGQEEPAVGAELEYANYQGIRVVGVHARSKKLGWGVVVEQPVAEAFAAVDRMKVETSVILISAMAVTLVLGMLSAGTVTRPLADLARGARRLGAGDFGHRIPVSASDEIGEVADRFNAMADRLHESFQRLRMILETSTMTSSSLELEQVLTTALERMDHLAGRAQSGIVLVEGPLGGGPVAATIRTLGADQGARSLTLGPDGFSHLWRALSAGETVILDDVAASAQPGERALWATQGLGGAVLIPLLAKGRILGALWMGRATPGPFSGEEVALAQTMANHIAIAIDNARLYDALRQTSEELESRVEARTRELREAHEELVRNERLALIGQLAGGVGHELRNPLGAMGNAVYYLRMRLAGNEDPKVLKHLGILEREGRRANKIITDLLDFSRVKPPSRVPAQLNAIVQDVLARVPEEPSVQRKLDLDESLPLVEVDQDQVGQVLLNLVDNAVEAMPEGGTLTIRTRATADGIVASVTDTGAGIPPENLEKVFQPLFTTKTRGIGLGLAVSRRLAAANGGTLRLTSRMGEGSTFTVAFPLNGSGPADHA
jgi:signal transduction histidine kinase